MCCSFICQKAKVGREKTWRIGGPGPGMASYQPDYPLQQFFSTSPGFHQQVLSEKRKPPYGRQEVNSINSSYSSVWLREQRMESHLQEFSLLPLRSTLATIHKIHRFSEHAKAGSLFKPKITLCFLQSVSSLICSVTLQATPNAHQLPRETKDTSCHSFLNQTGKGSRYGW